MDYRNILIVTLIILILAAGYFFYKDVELNPQNTIVNYIEQSTGYEIRYSSAKLWPLNELTVEDLNLVGDNFSLKVPKVNVSYSIFDYFNKQKSVPEIVKYIKLEQPNLSFNSTESEDNNQFSFSELTDSIFAQTDELYINIKEGNIAIKQADRNYKLSSLSTEIKIDSGLKNIKVDIKKGLKTSGLILNKYQLQNYTTKDFRISAELNNESWDLYLKNDNLKISEFNALFKENIAGQLADYQIENLTGTAKLDLHLSGVKENIESYQTNLIVTNSGFDFKLKDSSYQESIKVSEGSFHLNSKENKLYLENLNFAFNEVNYNFKGLYNLNKQDYSGQLKTENFQVNSDYLNNFMQENLPFDFSTNGTVSLNIDGNLDNFNLISNLTLNNLDLRGQQFSDIRAKVRYIDNTIYLDSLSVDTINNAVLNARGIYDLAKGSYNLKLKGDKVRLNTYLDDQYIRDFVGQYNLDKYLNGKIDFNLSTTGRKAISDNVVKAGFKYTPNRESILRENGVRLISGDLLYENNKLFLKEGNVNFNENQLNLFGEYNLNNQAIYAKLRGKDIGFAVLNNYFNMNFAKNEEFNINTLIKGKIDDPLIKGEINSKVVSYQDYTVQDIALDFSCSERKLNIDNLNFKFNEINLNGQGEIDINEDFNLAQSELAFNLEAEKINYKDLARYFEQELPIEGDIKPSISITGKLADIKAAGNFVSENTLVRYDGQEFEFDQIEATLTGSLEENRLELVNAVIRKDDFHTVVSGFYQNENIVLNFNADNFAMEELNLIENTSGIFDIEGKLTGSIDNPNLSFNFISNNFRYNRFLSEEFTGQITYNNDTIKFKDIKLNRRSSTYSLVGSIDGLRDNRNLDLKISTDRGNVRELMSIMEYNIPYSVNYPFSGSVNIEGDLSDPQAILELSLINNFKNIIEINGRVSNKIDLQIKGEQVPLELFKSANLLNFDFDYEGKLNFNGQVSGSREEFEVNLDTNLTALKILDIQLDDINGNLKYTSSGRLSFEQNLSQAQGQSIAAEGDIRVNERFIPEIEIDINNFSLNQIGQIDGNIGTLNGSIDGGVILRGEMQNPQLNGEVALNLSRLAIDGIANINSVKGLLSFDERKITLNDIKGKFGEGAFNITGNINYMNRENFWEVRLKGESFRFKRGSFNGYYNPDIRVLNEFNNPLIFGDLRLYDFVVDSELNWPESESETETQSPLFTPELKLNLIPGKNVYFRSENIDIQVEGGSLQLNYQEEELTFLGRLSSNQGTMDYYNNKFIVDNVTATFEKYSDNIPVIHLVGSTVAGGTRIFIYVDGPADNLNISFGSQPELPQDKIIALLTRRGGLKGFTSNGQVEPGSLVESELFRYVGEQVQLNFVQKVERSLANIFELDRFEIDTYSLAGEQEVTVYLGKDLTEKLYLQYTGTFSPEIRDNELTFEYDINKYLNLEGGWYGEDDYRFLLETTIEF
ncbi:MAG TPA: translocation/assembly module TamB domain-containing protein [Halanaerobiales bacterium]|nr:translocation/assembly module TamB domain-containing protein [Halanaerobiales bacterium]